MYRSRFRKSEVIRVLHEQEAGGKTANACRRAGGGHSATAFAEGCRAVNA